MTNDHELNDLIAMAKRLGAKVTVYTHTNREGRTLIESVTVQDTAGIGPHPMGPLSAAERLREFNALNRHPEIIERALEHVRTGKDLLWSCTVVWSQASTEERVVFAMWLTRVKHSLMKLNVSIEARFRALVEMEAHRGCWRCGRLMLPEPVYALNCSMCMKGDSALKR